MDPDLAHERIYIRLLPLIKQSQKDSNGATPHSPSPAFCHLSLSLSASPCPSLCFPLPVSLSLHPSFTIPLSLPRPDLNSVVPKQSFRPIPPRSPQRRLLHRFYSRPIPFPIRVSRFRFIREFPLSPSSRSAPSKIYTRVIYNLTSVIHSRVLSSRRVIRWHTNVNPSRARIHDR